MLNQFWKYAFQILRGPNKHIFELLEQHLKLFNFLLCQLCINFDVLWICFYTKIQLNNFLLFSQSPTYYLKIFYLYFCWCLMHFNISLVMMIIGFWINLISSEIFGLTWNFVVFIVESITFVSPWYDVSCFGLDFPLTLIFDTPMFSNEIISYEIMIVP